ncbi:MAG: universal stress protein [Desulfobacteraceae bacterium]
MKLEKILNPVDGSNHSVRATEYAVDLAKITGASIVLLHCHRKFPIILAEPHFQNAINTIMKESNHLIQPFVEILEKSGVSFETRILEGSAGRLIPEAAAIEKADIIVMGSRGCSDLEGLIIGSIAHKVLHGAVCPVLVIK